MVLALRCLGLFPTSPLACRSTRAVEHARATAADRRSTARHGDWASVVCRNSGDRSCSIAQNTGIKPPIVSEWSSEGRLACPLVRSRAGGCKRKAQGRSLRRCWSGKKTCRGSEQSDSVFKKTRPVPRRASSQVRDFAGVPAMVASENERVLFGHAACRLSERGEP